MGPLARMAARLVESFLALSFLAWPLLSRNSEVPSDSPCPFSLGRDSDVGSGRKSVELSVKGIPEEARGAGSITWRETRPLTLLSEN